MDDLIAIEESKSRRFAPCSINTPLRVAKRWKSKTEENQAFYKNDQDSQGVVHHVILSRSHFWWRQVP